MAEFHHEKYELLNNDTIKRKTGGAGEDRATLEEEGSVVGEIARYVQARIVSDFGFVSLAIPHEDAEISTSILVSPDWQSATKLMIIIQNASGSLLGVFSRSLCLEQGLARGSMLRFIQLAREMRYAVMVLRPNTNSVTADRMTAVSPSMSVPVKVPIQGSESPEAHVMFVWENIVPKAESVRHIVLLGYGNGAALCKDLYVRQMVRCREDEREVNRIRCIGTIEASHILEEDDAIDVKEGMGGITVNMESNFDGVKRGALLQYRTERLGCPTVCLGQPEGAEMNGKNAADSVSLGMDAFFSLVAMSEEGDVAGGQQAATTAPVGETVPLSQRFAKAFAAKHGLTGDNSVVTVNPSTELADEMNAVAIAAPSAAASQDAAVATGSAGSGGFFSRLFGWENRTQDGGKPRLARTPSGRRKSTPDAEEDVGFMGDSQLTVRDFDLLKVVGKGAFGKVMLVRKREGHGSGNIYAMKVLKKSVVAEKGQIEHTKSERSILCEIRHPFIVRLRFAFQSDEKLYLITDYYNGGSLFYHLRRSKVFSEARAKCYGAELLSALEHLHSQHIVYRDLKLENVLMDSEGHIALTDFGLSKQNMDDGEGAKTFCGTAEYIAPELLKGVTYGFAVDWWSFGILLYEMMAGKTPFYDKNRKLMFYRIINTPPAFPSTFSSEASLLISGLLTVNVEERWGSATRGGAKGIRESSFFSAVDFDLLLAKGIPPPFKPDVRNEFDTRYVPKTYLNTEAKDSIVEPMRGRGGRGGKGKGGANAHPSFDAFTFAGESAGAKALGGVDGDCDDMTEM